MPGFDKYDALLEPITKLFEDFVTSVVEDMAERLTKIDMSNDVAWKMQRTIESGGVYDDIIDRLAVLTKKSRDMLIDLFKKAGVEATELDDKIYEKAGLEVPPIPLSLAAVQILNAGLNKTSGDVTNLTMTTAGATEQAFIDAANMAYMKVANGTSSYDEAIREAALELAEQGIVVVVYPSGHRDQVDVALRRAVLTGVAQTTGSLQLQRAIEMGTNLVQTSAHVGSRPTHEPWQGRVFSILGGTTEYPNFVESTGFGKIDGLMGINCRHTFYPFFEGISENAYKESDVAKMEEERVTYNGKEMTVYEASQQQRAMEREVRKHKRAAAALEKAGQDNSSEIEQIRKWQAKLRDFTAQTGLYRQGGREQIITSKAKAPKKLVPPYVEAKSIEQAEEYARSLGIKDVDYKGLDLKVVNEVNRSMHDNFELFPEMMGHVDFAGSEDHYNDRVIQMFADELFKKIRAMKENARMSDAQLRKAALDVAQRDAPTITGHYYGAAASGYINGPIINPRWDHAKLSKAVKHDERTGFHPKGCGTIKAIYDHEFGHILSAYFDLTKDPELLIVWERARMEPVLWGVSGYARGRGIISEWIAESWSEYRNNDTPTPSAITVGKKIKQKIAAYPSFSTTGGQEATDGQTVQKPIGPPKFSTVEEANKFFKSLGFKKVDFEGVDLQLAESFANVVLKYKEIRPEIVKDIGAVGSVQFYYKLQEKEVRKYITPELENVRERRKYGGLPPLDPDEEEELARIVMRKYMIEVPESAYAMTAPEGAAKGVYVTDFMTYEEFMARVLENAETGFHSPHAKDADSIFHHEIAHVIDNTLEVHHNFDLAYWWILLHNSPNASEIIRRPEWAVSTYAYEGEDIHEWIAEMWVDYVYNPNPTPLVRFTGELMTRMQKGDKNPLGLDKPDLSFSKHRSSKKPSKQITHADELAARKERDKSGTVWREYMSRMKTVLPPKDAVRPEWRGSRQGECYTLAAKFVEQNKGWTLVHATLLPLVGPFADTPYFHAFAMKGNMVYDPVFDKYYSRESYFEAMVPADIRIYNQLEMYEKMSEEETYGPWK